MIRGIYRQGAGMTSTAIEAVRGRVARALMSVAGLPMVERAVAEDEALAILRALGDDGSALRQAVALASVGMSDDVLEDLIGAWMRGGVS